MLSRTPCVTKPLHLAERHRGIAKQTLPARPDQIHCHRPACMLDNLSFQHVPQPRRIARHTTIIGRTGIPDHHAHPRIAPFCMAYAFFNRRADQSCLCAQPHAARANPARRVLEFHKNAKSTFCRADSRDPRSPCQKHRKWAAPDRPALANAAGDCRHRLRIRRVAGLY